MKLELVAMEHMSCDIFEELHEAREALKQVSFATTILGRLVNMNGYFFSGYCVYKMMMASINIVFNRVAQVCLRRLLPPPALRPASCALHPTPYTR